jgi:extradiol dioxygenase family protein
LDRPLIKIHPKKADESKEVTLMVSINHLIVPSHDKRKAAEFLAHILGIADGAHELGPHSTVQISDSLLIHFDNAENFAPYHFAFHVTDGEFDEILERIKATGISYAGDPASKETGTINHRYEGRGFYFANPDGHLLEVSTRGESIALLRERMKSRR